MECWAPKVDGASSALSRHRPQEAPLGLLDWLEDVPAWALLAPGLAVAGIVLGVVLLG